MIATRGDAGAEEEHEEDQVPVRAPSPPSVLLASPQGGGLGWRLLSSIRALSGIGLPPPPGPKAGLGLLLHLKGDQQPHHHAEEPFDEASSSSAAAALEVQCAGPEWPQPTVGAAAKGLSLAGDRCRLTDQCIGVAWGPTHKNVLTLPHWLKQGVVDECAADSALQAGELGATQNDGALEEGAINKQGAAKDVITVMDQWTTDKSKATKDENTVEAKDKVMEQEGATEKQDTTRDGNATKYQEEVVEQGVIDEKSAIKDDVAGDDQEKVLQQCTSDHLRATMDDQEAVEQGVIDQRDETTGDLAVEDQEKAVEQCATYELGTVENNDDVDDHEAVDRGVIDKGSATMDDNAVKDHEVVEQSAIDRMRTTTDDIAVEDQEKVVEQCAVDESRATKDEHTVEEKEKVVGQGVIDRMHTTMDEIAVEDQEKVVEQCAVDESRATKGEYVVEEKEKVLEQGVIDKQGAMPMDVTAKNQKEVEQGIIDNQGTMQMDDIAVKDWDKAVGPYASDAIIASKDENPVEEHKKVGDQGAIAENGRTKDDIDVEEKGYVKKHGIIDEWGRSNDCIALEDLKNEAELCIGDEQIAIKDVVAVHIQGNMLEQRISDEQGATKFKLTVEKDKEVVECVRHEWDATEDDLAMDTTASEGVSGISSSEVVSVTSYGSDGGIVKKEKVKLSVRYPQRPGKLNCPFYMSKGSCSYGFSCHFNHPRLKAKSDVWFPSEQGNHGAAGILELNRIGLPIREGARSCTYYMRNGACRYGKKCHFNHPEQAIDAQFYPPTGWEDNALPSSPHLRKSSDHTTLHDTSYTKKSSDHTTLDATSYLKRSTNEGRTSYSKKSSDHATLDDTSSSSEVLPPNILRMLLPPQKVPPSTEGKVMKVKKNSNWSSTSDDSDGCCSADSSDGPLCKQEHVDYPERPGRLECPFYTRFDDCKFASACKYHHSKDRYPTRYHTKDSSMGELIKYPERPGEPQCPFYMKNRWCKFGAQCNFHHPKDLNPTTRSPTNAKKSVAANEHHPATRITLKDDVPQQQQYPERPGQPDCRYYMQFGKCKYLSACIFHHPKDRLASGWHPSDPAQSDQYDTWQPTNISRLENLCQQAQVGTEIHGMPACPFYMKTRKCQLGSACEFRHLKDVCSTTEEAFGHGTDLAYDNFTRSENVVQKQEHAVYPERPGEPECSHYMRHGSCKFQMNCKYHHPSDRLSKKPYDLTYH